MIMDGQPQRGALTAAQTTARSPRCGSECTDERPWRYAEVACQRCAAVVNVVKFSAQHTSVQWTADAVLTCAEFRARVLAGEPSALIATCLSLRASIDAAVADGLVKVLPP
jgi:hypothetical protein